MPDPFKRWHPGDRVSFSAIAENAKLDVAEWFKKHRRDLEAGDFTPTNRSPDLVRVWNDTGMDLPSRSVLGLDVPLWTPATDLDAFLREVCFRGIVPANTHRGKFAVLLEGAHNQQVCRAFISGVCPVKVVVQNLGDAYADVKIGDTGALLSAGVGSAKILYCEQEGSAPYDDNVYTEGYVGGEYWAIVRLGLEAGRARGCMAPAGGIPAANSDGTIPGHAVCTMYDWDHGSQKWLSSGVSETVYNNGGAATSAAKIILVVYHQGTPFAVVDQC
jgi:hypothetical protein